MSVFEVRPEHLDHLTPEKSVDLIRKLIWAEATISGINFNTINVPSNITANDGGIDGIVTDTHKDGKFGIIRKGLTCYQIKSGAFSLNDSSIKSILFKDKSNELKDQIKSCLEKQGTFIIAFTKYDNPDTTDNFMQEKFKNKLISISPKYKNSKIEIWRQNTICGFLTNFPALRLDILGISTKFLLHEHWSKFEDMKSAIKLGRNQNQFIENCRNILMDEKKSMHIRVLGEPGIGKTRLVLEATNTNNLNPLVLYAEDPSCLDERNFIQSIQHDSNPQLILIIDECDYETSAKIWNKLKNNTPIKLITIFNEPDNSSGTTRILYVSGLNDEEIGKIIKEYVPDNHQISKWINSCKLSPRAAHIIGGNLKNNPEDLFKSPDVVPVWKRYIGSSISFDTDEFKNRETVLLWISLFKKFGFESPFESEGKKIASYIQKHHNIPSATFTAIIKKLKNMKILQGHSTLYITPKLLHIYLWIEWWKRFDINIAPKVEELILPEEQQPNNLANWYCKMLVYAPNSPEVHKIISKLLVQCDFFDDNDELRASLKADFFLTLSKSYPVAALDYLYEIIGKKSKKDLENFSFGRREIVWSLELIAQYKECFERASYLLLSLAEAENEDFSNNATGTFVKLFSSWPGQVAPTEVPPKDRIPILEYAINSESQSKNHIAIQACNNALQMNFFSQLTIDPGEFSKMPNLWEPRSKNEINEYHQIILDILALQLDKHKNQDAIVDIILNHLIFLLSAPILAEKTIKILQKIHDIKTYDERLFGAIIYIIELKSDKLQPNILRNLEDLQNNINGTDFHSLMRRYVGMDMALDWSIDENRIEKQKHEIKKLTITALVAKNLEPELSWLVTDEAKNGYQFGYELAQADTAYSLLQLILTGLRRARDKGSGFFIGGYFLHINENNPKKWEVELEKIYNDPVLYRLLPEITLRSGISDKASDRIIRGINEGKLDYTVLGIFKYGSAFLDKLSKKSFLIWIILLLKQEQKNAIFIALNLFYSYFVSKNKKSLPRELTLKLILDNRVFHTSHMINDTMDSFNWKEIALEFIKQYPEDTIKIAETIFAHITMDRFSQYDYNTREVLDAMAKIKPREIWKAATRYIGPPLDSRASNILDWLRGGLFRSKDNSYDKIAFDDITDWIDEDKKSRASYIANFLPIAFETTRNFLIRYGDQENVRKSLMANYENESWMGSAIIHYMEKMKKFENFKENEKHPTVLSWLNQYIRLIKDDIERSKKQEERNPY